MELGISSYSFPWNIGVAGYAPQKPFTAFDLLAFASNVDIRRVQIGDNLPLHELSSAELAQLAAEARARAITIEAGARRLTEDHLLKYLDIARQFGSPFLRIVIDDKDYEPDVHTIINEIKAVLPAFKESQVVLAIENHDRFSSLTLKSIVEQTDPQYVAICLDTANSFGALEGTYETVRLLAPHAINLHIKDITVARVAHKMGFNIAGAAAGEGVLDLARIIDTVKQHGRCISATLELWSDFETDIETTTKVEKERVQRSINHLKQYFK